MHTNVVILRSSQEKWHWGYACWNTVSKYFTFVLIGLLRMHHWNSVLPIYTDTHGLCSLHTQYCVQTAHSPNHWQHGTTVLMCTITLLVQTSAAVTESNWVVEAKDGHAAPQVGLVHRWMSLTYIMYIRKCRSRVIILLLVSFHPASDVFQCREQHHWHQTFEGISSSKETQGEDLLTSKLKEACISLSKVDTCSTVAPEVEKYQRSHKFHLQLLSSSFYIHTCANCAIS